MPRLLKLGESLWNLVKLGETFSWNFLWKLHAITKSWKLSLYTPYPRTLRCVSYMFSPKTSIYGRKSGFPQIVDYYICTLIILCEWFIFFFNFPYLMSIICHRFWFFFQNCESKMAKNIKVLLFCAKYGVWGSVVEV